MEYPTNSIIHNSDIDNHLVSIPGRPMRSLMVNDIQGNHIINNIKFVKGAQSKAIPRIGKRLDHYEYKMVIRISTKKIQCFITNLRHFILGSCRTSE